MTEIPMATLGVHIKVANIARSRDFYGKLGFQKELDYGPGTPSNECYHGTFYRIGDSAKLELSDAHEVVEPEVFDSPITNAKVSIFVKVSSLVPFLKRVRAYDFVLEHEPRHFDWKAFEMTVIDPDGLRIVFTSPDDVEDVEALRRLTEVDLFRTEPDYSRARLIR